MHCFSFSADFACASVGLEVIRTYEDSKKPEDYGPNDSHDADGPPDDMMPSHRCDSADQARDGDHRRRCREYVELLGHPKHDGVLLQVQARKVILVVSQAKMDSDKRQSGLRDSQEL